MTEQAQLEIKKAKRRVYTVFAIFMGLLLVGVAGALLRISRPVDKSLMPEGLAASVETCGCLAKTESGYYGIEGSEELADLLAVESWLERPGEISGEPVVTIRLAEEYYLKLYSGGQAAAFNGYAARNRKSSAYYTIPQGVAESAAAYLEEYGTEHTYGDGTITASTFQ